MAGKIREKTSCVCLVAIRYERRERERKRRESVRPTGRCGPKPSSTKDTIACVLFKSCIIIGT